MWLFMNTKQKKAQNLRQVLLLITAQALAITSMIWGGSLTVDAQETSALTEHVIVSTSPCQGAPADADVQHQATASRKKLSSGKLLDFSIGKPWG